MAIEKTLANYMKSYMKKPLILLFLSSSLLLAVPASAELYVTIIQGLSGQAEYKEKFDDQRAKVTLASRSLTSADHVTTIHGDDASRENLLTHFQQLAGRMTDSDRAAIYLIGHGSYDGDEYKFNIPGPDITTTDLDDILNSLPGQNHFLVNTSSTSGAILEDLENENRIIITATRNGNERNSTEFGTYFAAALSSEEADLNKNNNISIQEAFDYAEREVADFFESSGRLATEHPQIRGEGAAQFSLARVTPVETQNENPTISRLLERRLGINADIEDLQLKRGQYSNTEYIQLLQALILESATITEEIELLSEEQNAEPD